jgi:murein DD-endopeptidase MepM/ murein hydrolase activator NlpD
MRYLLGFFVLLIIYSLTVACVSLRENAGSDFAGENYQVKKGDSLDDIAKRYRMSPSEIMEINGLDNKRALRVGQVLYLPDPDPIGSQIKKHKAKIVAPIKNNGKKTSAKSQAFTFPVPSGKIFRAFSESKKQPYDGIGISAKRGASVLAAQKGKVIFAGDDGTKFGLLIIIAHAEPFISVYTHLEKSLVKKGDNVDQGQTIAAVGSSGGVKNPQLHFQIREAERVVDPIHFLKTP